MQPHPYFDLLLHTDGEIEAYFGSPVSDRRTLHEWPLSCVERLVLEDGRRLVYKAQSLPTVEPEFYLNASSPVLSAVDVLFREGKYSSLTMEYLDIPHLWDLHLSEADLRQIGMGLRDVIQQVQGDYPVYLDISSWDRWQAVMAEMTADLRGLVQAGAYTCVTPEMVDRVEAAATSAAVRDAYAQPVGLVHGDLGGDNVFLLPDGSCRIIDWQRPLIGPIDLDLAHLADSFEIDPGRWVTPGIAAAFSLLRIQWLTACTLHWFPPGRETYDETIAKIVPKI